MDIGVGLGNRIGWLAWMQASKLKKVKVKVRKQVVYVFGVENQYMTNWCQLYLCTVSKFHPFFS